MNKYVYNYSSIYEHVRLYGSMYVDLHKVGLNLGAEPCHYL